MAERNPAPGDQPVVFICYSRRDLAFVDRLQAGLEKRGIATFVDREAIAKGEEWWARIQQLIGEADTIVFVPLYTGGSYDYSIDFFFDGAINLSDLVLYAGGLNTSCP